MARHPVLTTQRRVIPTLTMQWRVIPALTNHWLVIPAQAGIPPFDDRGFCERVTADEDETAGSQLSLG